MISVFGIARLSAQSPGYNDDRRSFSIIYVEDAKQAGQHLRTSIPPEFQNSLFWNDIKTQKLNNITLDLFMLGKQMTNMGIGNEILAYWWNRRSDGLFNLGKVAERGRYNAQDIQQQVALKGLRGQAEMEDAGLKLIAESYVLVVSPLDLHTMKEDYDRQDERARLNGSSERAKRTSRGYVGQVEGYLYKLVYDDKSKNDFYNMWIYENDSSNVKAQKIKAFDSYRFELQHVKRLVGKGIFGDITSVASISDNEKSDDQLLAGWARKAMANLFEEIFKKAMLENNYQVVEKHPVKAKIGIKEGVYPEKKFIIYERKERPNGKIVRRRRAVVRAKNISDNGFESTGNTSPSTCYRVGGIGIIQPGMEMKTRREVGLSVHMLYGMDVPKLSTSPIIDYGLGVEGNLSLYLGKLGNTGAPVGFKLGLNYTVLSDLFYVASIVPVEATASRWLLYLRKDMYFLSIFHVGIFSGFGYDVIKKSTANETDPQKSFGSMLVPAGAEIGMNMFRIMQVFGLMEYSIPVFERLEDGKTTAGLPKWYTIYPERKGVTFRAGFRVSF